MLLPDDPKRRAALYRNLIRQCESSRENRRAQYQRLRLWYLTGAETGQRARYNKLDDFVNQASSYIYSAESLRFGVVLPPKYGDQWIEEEAVAGDEIHRLWHDGDAGITAGVAAKWAWVYPTVIAKVLTDDNEPAFQIIPDPADVGVLCESVHEWDRQEAICHWYSLDLASFTRLVANHPDAAQLIALAQEHAAPGRGQAATDVLPSAIQNIVIAQSSPNMIGAVRNLVAPIAMPEETEPVVDLAELWVWDDEIEDFRVATNFLPTERILWNPRNPLLPGKHPFHPLCLDPTPGYLWGVPALENLLLLQQWRSDRMDDVDFLLKKQLRPPLFGSGISGIMEEKMKALRHPDGIFTNPMPGGDVKPIVTPMPPDAFAEIEKIDQMFDRAAGLPSAMRGEGPTNVRSGEQAVAHAMLGAGPTLAKAMILEDWIESVATALLRLRLRTCTTALRKPDGTEFLLSQIPDEFTVRVSAHSASPIYQQQTFQKGLLLKREGAIDNESLIRMAGVPLEDILRAKSRELAKAQARIVEKRLQIAEKKAEKTAR